MSKQNKVLCNLDQQLTKLQKYTARANIGTFRMYDIQPTSTTHTIDQTEAANGQFSFSKVEAQAGLYLLSLHLYISPAGTKPNDSVVPLHITVDRHYSGGSSNAVVGYTADLTQLEQNGPWQTRIDIFQTITTQDLTILEFEVNFEANKIPQGTPVRCYVTGVFIGNTKPTP